MESNNLLYNEQAEIFVIGALLNSEECYFSVADRLTPAFFSNAKISRLASVIVLLHNQGKKVNIISVTEYLLSHPDYNNPEAWEIADYSTSTVLSAFDDSFATIESLYVRRRYFSLGAKLMEFGTNRATSIEEIQKEISEVLHNDTEKKNHVKSLREANEDLKHLVWENHEGKNSTMISTGFDFLDSKGGFQFGDFNVIAAESSAGKTSLFTTIMVNAASVGIPCMMYSMEMQSTQIAARIVAPRAKISSGIIQYKRLDDWQMNELSQAMKQTDVLPIFFDEDSTLSIDSIISSIRRNVVAHSIKLVGIDYLQILSATGKITNHEQFMGSVARRLKNLAKELKICIVALSQLARNNLEPKPTLGRVRASGQIVEAADTVMLIWRPSEYGKSYDDFPTVSTEGTAEIIIGKGRNIGTGSFIVGFDKTTTNFYNYTGVFTPVEVNADNNSGKPQIPFPEPEQGELPF